MNFVNSFQINNLQEIKRSQLVKRLVLLIGTLTLLVCTSLPAVAQQSLKIYTWSEYMHPEIVAEFEQKFAAKIEFNYFESDQARDEELAAVAGVGYDLILINSIQVERYGKRGWLESIDWAAIPNSRHFDPNWTHAFNTVGIYAVPYFWGTMGIAYRKDLIPEGIHSWLELLNPKEALRGKIVMISDAREITAIALQAAGHSANSTDSSHISDARDLLLMQRPYVQTYAYPNSSEESVLVTGDVWAASMYSGDVMVLQDRDENIAYSLPKEGGLIWVDYFTVAKASTEKELAHKFLNFIHQPEIAARQAEWVSFATPNKAAAELVSDEYTNNLVINPSVDTLKDSEHVKSMPPRARKKINSIGAELFREAR